MQQYFQESVLHPGTNQTYGSEVQETHIMGLHPIAASGSIYLRSHMHELRTEFLSFPRGAHDDLIDALAMQTQMWKRTKSKKEVDESLLLSDPFSVDSVIAELQMKARRKRLTKDSLIFSPMDVSSTLRAG